MSSETPSRHGGTARDAYLAAQVRQHDRDRYLTTLFAPAGTRRALWALYAFYNEVARVPESVSEPLLGRMKLQWWRDTAAAMAHGRGAPAGHPFAQEMAGVLADEPRAVAW